MGSERPEQHAACLPSDAMRLNRLHHRRLREIYRSAGWPCHDPVEIELLAAGLLERRVTADGRERLDVTPAGIEVLAQALGRNRAAFDAHAALVEHVALGLARGGRLVWRELPLRARVQEGGGVQVEPLPLFAREDAAGDASEGWAPAARPPGRWCVARPDVFSVRHTSVEAYLEPVVHEIKVRRGDLLADLRVPTKRAAYLAVAGQCYYVIREGIAEPDEIPPECGVVIARGEADRPRLEAVRSAPRHPLPGGRLPFVCWMALARAAPLAPALDPAQPLLHDCEDEDVHGRKT